jgi:hypothetical protein
MLWYAGISKDIERRPPWSPGSDFAIETRRNAAAQCNATQRNATRRNATQRNASAILSAQSTRNKAIDPQSSNENHEWAGYGAGVLDMDTNMDMDWIREIFK